jgi:hypothetical protein
MPRYPEKKITVWCFAKEDYREGSLAPVPCRKEACERYRPRYPHCVMMEMRGEKGEFIERG